ncbi:MAG: LysR substrate-binding domain-containing protein [Clostridium sp.]|nr:MAG: LysR substrate-binding domain-containing protein [Clostridium sp.]
MVSCYFSLAASICVGFGHSLSHKQKKSIFEQLQKETIITNLESGSNDLLELALKKDNLSIETLPNVLKINDAKMVKDLVINGIGLALIYDDYIENDLKDKNLYFEFLKIINLIRILI